MEEKKTILTYEGLRKLEDELENLKVVKRKEVAGKIKEAREQGDLSENAEYDAAKDHQAKVESEIIIIQDQLDHAKIIEETSGKPSTVMLGCTVKIKDLDENEELEYTIVGTTEASILEGKISNEAPLAKAILGKKIGAVVPVNTGDYSYDVKVLDISK